MAGCERERCPADLQSARASRAGSAVWADRRMDAEEKTDV